MMSRLLAFDKPARQDVAAIVRAAGGDRGRSGLTNLEGANSLGSRGGGATEQTAAFSTFFSNPFAKIRTHVMTTVRPSDGSRAARPRMLKKGATTSFPSARRNLLKRLKSRKEYAWIFLPFPWILLPGGFESISMGLENTSAGLENNSPEVRRYKWAHAIVGEARPCSGKTPEQVVR
jgi:hypothetical protein